MKGVLFDVEHRGFCHSVMSVPQADIILYGNGLADHVQHEFTGRASGLVTRPHDGRLPVVRHRGRAGHRRHRAHAVHHG
ncbi:hypothetical protein ASE09_29955 [Streptomyces sp. Root66D1]|nr:hypothetical protein ASD33_20740 [Streptomyces sp. Root1304]KRA94560.1 hypothetical protein ASE09_29955 [Streptomyces sp. Root66D1]